MNSNNPFKIKPGIYKVYNDAPIEAVMSIMDKATGAEFVVCKKWCCLRSSDYFLVGKDEFLSEYVDKYGKTRRVYEFQPYDHETDSQLEDIVDDGFEFVQDRIERRQAKRNERDEKYLRKRTPRCFENYFDYAKDLIENRTADVSRIRLCRERKEYVGISKDNLKAIIEDQHFVLLCFDGPLSEFKTLFEGLYSENHLSVRKYAEVNGTNRGSVEYLKNKMFRILAAELESRDNADGVNRLQKLKVDMVAGLTEFAKSCNTEPTLEQSLSLLMFEILDEGTAPQDVGKEINENGYEVKVASNGSELLEHALNLLQYYAGGDEDVPIREWHEVMKKLENYKES